MDQKERSIFDRFQTFVFLVNVLGEVPVSWTPSQWAPRGRTVLAYFENLDDLDVEMGGSDVEDVEDVEDLGSKPKES